MAVATQPASSLQTCTVTGGKRTVTSDVVDVLVGGEGSSVRTGDGTVTVA